MHLSLLPGPRPTARFVRKSPRNPRPAREGARRGWPPASDEENQTPAVNAVEPVPFDPDPVKDGRRRGRGGRGDTRRATEGDDVTHQTEPDAGVDAAEDAAEDAVADEATDGASRDDDRGSARSARKRFAADDPDGDAAEGSRVRPASSSSSSSSSTLDEARGRTAPAARAGSDSLAGAPAPGPRFKPVAARRGDVPRESRGARQATVRPTSRDWTRCGASPRTQTPRTQTPTRPNSCLSLCLTTRRSSRAIRAASGWIRARF